MATFDEVISEAESEKKNEDSAFEAWRADPSPANMRAAIASIQPAINSAIKANAGASAGPTVAHRARLLAAKAIRSYDPTKGAKLATHVASHLRGLRRMTPEIVDPFPPAERFRQQQIEISQAVDTLSDKLGREPTDEEIAEVTGLRPERVIRVRTRMRARVPTSVYEDSDDDEAESEVETSAITDEDHWRDAVYHDLGPIDRLIFMHRTGYRGADVLDNTTLAKRLGVSPAAVSQRASRIQAKLDEFHG